MSRFFKKNNLATEKTDGEADYPEIDEEATSAVEQFNIKHIQEVDDDVSVNMDYYQGTTAMDDRNEMSN